MQRHVPVLSAYGQPPRVFHGYGASRPMPRVLHAMQGFGNGTSIPCGQPGGDCSQIHLKLNISPAQLACMKIPGSRWNPTTSTCAVPTTGTVGGGTPVAGGVPTWAYIAGGMVLVGGAAWYFLK